MLWGVDQKRLSLHLQPHSSFLLGNAHGSYLDKGNASSKSSRHSRNLCYCSSTPQLYAQYIPEPSPMSGKPNWGGNFLLMNYSFERKGLHSTATGAVDDMDVLSLIGCISALEVFRLNRDVLCYRHSLSLHGFRRLVLHAKFSDLIGKLLELKYIRTTRAQRYHRLYL